MLKNTYDVCVSMGEKCSFFYLFSRIVERGFYSEQDAAEVVRQLCQAIKVRKT